MLFDSNCCLRFNLFYTLYYIYGYVTFHKKSALPGIKNRLMHHLLHSFLAVLLFARIQRIADLQLFQT